MRTLAEALGALAVVAGVGVIFWPAALILAGAILIFWANTPEPEPAPEAD